MAQGWYIVVIRGDENELKKCKAKLSNGDQVFTFSNYDLEEESGWASFVCSPEEYCDINEIHEENENEIVYRLHAQEGLPLIGDFTSVVSREYPNLLFRTYELKKNDDENIRAYEAEYKHDEYIPGCDKYWALIDYQNFDD
jgi:hypothetical protein